MARARLIGINHVALEVGDLEAALAFYGGLFGFELRGRAPGMAFLDMGDQFIALSEGRSQPADEERHFGLVVDDLDAATAALDEHGVQRRGNDFRDPWGNNLQLVDYREIQFTKAPGAARKLGITGLAKSEAAQAEIREKGLG